jgi:hypothetical protein
MLRPLLDSNVKPDLGSILGPYKNETVLTDFIPSPLAFDIFILQFPCHAIITLPVPGAWLGFGATGCL